MVRVRKDLEEAARILKKGGVVIFPTDTVYGIGCRFDDSKAIDRIYKIKKTPRDQLFPVLVSSIDQVKKLAQVTKVAEKLITEYWPGALTIILPGLHMEKIGIRMPDSILVLDLIGQVGVPIIGTSANFHGRVAPKSFNQLDPKFIKLADFVIKGKCKEGIGSTVIDATVNPPKILRKGAVKLMSLNPVIPAKAGI